MPANGRWDLIRLLKDNYETWLLWNNGCKVTHNFDSEVQKMEEKCKGKFLSYCLIGSDAVLIGKHIGPFKFINCLHLQGSERGGGGEGVQISQGTG
jgi:hypothetical protein